MDENKKPADTDPPAEATSFFDPFAPSLHRGVPTSPEPEPDPIPEPAPASMAMTKAELLDRLANLEAASTKATILARITVLERGEAPPAVSAATLAAMPGAPAPTETCHVSLNGISYSWQAGREDTVPPEAVAIWQQSKAANP